MGRLVVNLKGQRKDETTKRLVNTYNFKDINEDESRNVLGRWQDREFRKVTYYPEGKPGVLWEDRK